MKLRESRPAQILGAFAFCGHDVAKAGTDSANVAVRKSHRLVEILFPGSQVFQEETLGVVVRTLQLVRIQSPTNKKLTAEITRYGCLHPQEARRTCPPLSNSIGSP
jgi:hypothetical protein